MSGRDEMVRLRKPYSRAFPAGSRWKITARYTVDLGRGKSLKCVRVRVGCGPTLHFSAERFRSLFEPIPEPPP